MLSTSKMEEISQNSFVFKLAGRQIDRQFQLQLILANLKIWCSKMQPLSGNQRPDFLTSLMNMSLVLRLPREIHLCRSSWNVPRLPSFFGNATKPSRFARFWQGAEPLGQNDASMSKSGANMWRFNLLTWKCASRHNGVSFFNISASKSAPRLVCFVHFDFEMCFAPQRRALFWHCNFQKCSDVGVLYVLTLDNGVRFFGISTYKNAANLVCFAHFDFECALRRARCFSEPTFRPSGATNHWKNTVFRDFATFSRTCIFFFLTLSLLWSSFFFSSLLWLFPPLLFHLPISSEVWLLNFLRLVSLCRKWLIPLQCHQTRQWTISHL